MNLTGGNVGVETGGTWIELKKVERYEKRLFSVAFSRQNFINT